MKVLVVGLIYGSRSLETLEETLKRSGYSADVILINQGRNCQCHEHGVRCFS